MAQVTIRINGYAYPVGCEDGQEEHLQAMAAQVEARIDSIKKLGGQSGEARLLVLAALLMADELHDRAIELADARHARPVRDARPEPGVARTINRLARRAEDIAAALERD